MKGPPSRAAAITEGVIGITMPNCLASPSFTVPQPFVATVVTVATDYARNSGGKDTMFQPLRSMTKAVAVALDIAGRPDTEDAYALNSVRKAYRLLNGGTFQDLVTGHDNAPSSMDFGFDWSEAYRLESSKNEALTRQVAELKAELEGKRQKAQPGEAQPWRGHGCNPQLAEERSPRIERAQAQILASLRGTSQTAPQLSRSTNIQLRTVQRRLRELVANGLVEQATEGISPVYSLVMEC